MQTTADLNRPVTRDFIAAIGGKTPAITYRVTATDGTRTIDVGEYATEWIARDYAYQLAQHPKVTATVTVLKHGKPITGEPIH